MNGGVAVIKKTIQKISEKKIIAVLRGGDSCEKVIGAVEALVAGGISAIEITYTTRNPLEIIKRLAGRKEILLGAGTILNLKDARDAVAAGAEFVVSPCLIPEVIAFGIKKNLLMIPGVFTPTEAYQAMNLGAAVLKLFPGSIGGPEQLKALRGPFPGIQVIPTGGVNKENIRDWFAAGALAVGVGGNLVSKQAIEKEDYELIKRYAAEIVSLANSNT